MFTHTYLISFFPPASSPPQERIADFVHGDDGFGNTQQESMVDGLAPAPGSAAEFIVRTAAAHPGEVTVLALASLTNVALALQLDPDLPKKLVRNQRSVLVIFVFIYFALR